jgi:CRISPR-associated RAMP protein (TIGR02581 family)
VTAAKTAYNYASFEQLHNHLHVEGELVAQTAMRVGAGRASDVIGNDLPVLRDALSRPFIPGASLKGAFRARLEALIATVAPGEVRDFEALERFTRTEVPALKQKYRDNDRRLSQEIWQRSTMIDLTFGSPELAGRLFFKDALVQKDIWFGQFEVRNGVVLNRDTETAESGLLYDYEVVPAETRFDFELVLENAEDWQLGMVMLALQPWIRGDAQIGGFRSRGLGHIKLDEETLKCHYIQIDSVDAVLRMLECGSAQDTISFDGKRVKQWREAFAAKLTACAKAQQPEEEPRA